MNKRTVLTKALEYRDQEIFDYQINIDNYTLAIARIDAKFTDNQDLQGFRKELVDRLFEESRQQLRAQVIRDVIASQLEELP